MEEKASSPLIPPPSEIDLEAGGGGDQLQCRICLETDGEGGGEAPGGRRLPFYFPFLGFFFSGGDLSGRLCAGRDFIAPCKCKGTSKYVHRDCLDHWRAVKVSAAAPVSRRWKLGEMMSPGVGEGGVLCAFSAVSNAVSYPSGIGVQRVIELCDESVEG
jgi:hypothetical protein